MSREQAIRVRVTVKEGHWVRLPDEVPLGEAEVIVLVPTGETVETERQRKARRRAAAFGSLRDAFTIARDFDAPLPEDVLRDFEDGE